MLPILIGLLAAILAAVIVYRLTLGVQLLRSRRAAQFDVVAGRSSAVQDRALGSERTPRSTRDRLRAAGVDLGTNAETTFQLMRIALAIIAAVIVLVLGLPITVALLAGLAGYGYPGAWLAGQAHARTLQIEKELPDALGDLVALLRVTPALRNALEQTRALLLQMNPQSPLAQELQWTLEDFQTDEAGAFRELAQRTASPALAMLAFALDMFVKSGGDYLAALEAQARGVRQTLEARGEAQAQASDALMAVKVIPIILGAVTLAFMQDPFFRSFYFSFAGQMLILAVLGSMFLGYQLVQAMVSEVA